MNSQDILEKKKKVITLLLLFVFIVMMLIGFLLGSWAYNFAKEHESQNENVNTLYVDEKANRRK
ncbi:MAG: hypothetical protein K2H53_04300 [Clostridia bacterium]|nr:hypothetical protein [Clostridia bacterium]